MVERISELGTVLAVTSNLITLCASVASYLCFWIEVHSSMFHHIVGIHITAQCHVTEDYSMHTHHSSTKLVFFIIS
jgi:hypothetical protein